MAGQAAEVISMEETAHKKMIKKCLYHKKMIDFDPVLCDTMITAEAMTY